MSGATFTDVDTYGLLKELYADDVEMQENIVNSFYNFLRKADSSEVEFDGKYWNQGVVFQLLRRLGATKTVVQTANTWMTPSKELCCPSLRTWTRTHLETDAATAQPS